MDTFFWLMRSLAWVHFAIKNVDNDMNHRHALELSAVISFLLCVALSLAAFLFFTEHNTATVTTFFFFTFVLYHSTGIVFYVLNVEPEHVENKSKWQNSGPW